METNEKESKLVTAAKVAGALLIVTLVAILANYFTKEAYEVNIFVFVFMSFVKIAEWILIIIAVFVAGLAFWTSKEVVSYAMMMFAASMLEDVLKSAAQPRTSGVPFRYRGDVTEETE